MHIEASHLPRLVQCGASATMPVNPPSGMVATNDDREEGKAAHWLAMQRLTGKLADVSEMIDRKAENGYYIDSDMAEHAENYVQSCLSNSGTRYVEQTMSFNIGPELRIGARPDHLVQHKLGTIVIDEFKYGWSLVEPDNWTMLAYAMAFCATRSFDQNVMFILRIHQPRPYHQDGPIRQHRIMYTDLMATQQRMANHLLSNRNTLATGPSCKYCPSLSVCPAARKAALNSIDIAQNKFVDDLPSDVIGNMLDEIDIAKKRLENYQNALQEAAYTRLMKGDRIANYKLEPSTGNLEWLDWVNPQLLKSIYPQKKLTKETAITPTQAKKVLGEDIVKQYSDRPNKGLKLVRYNPQKEAQRMFGKDN